MSDGVLPDAASLDDEHFRKLSRFYAALSECNAAILHSTSEADLFLRICRAAVDVAGMKMAWIGMVDAEGPDVREVASYGAGTEYLHGLRITLDAGEPAGRGPTGTAVREDHPVWCQDFLADPRTEPWHERGRRFGWGASAALPLRRDGRPVGALTFYAPRRDAFDAATRGLLVQMAADISFGLDNLDRARQAAQSAAALALSEARWRFALDGGAHGIWEWDARTDRVFFSHGWKAMLGYADAEIGDTLEEWRSRVHPEDLASTLAAIERHFSGEEPDYRSEHRVRCKDGRYKWILDRGRAIRRGADGRPEVVVGTHTDIDDHRRAEARLRDSERRFHTMFAEAPLGMALIDSLDGHILELNRKYAEIVGRSVDELRRIDWMRITHPDDVQPDLDGMARLNAGEVPGYEMKKRYLRPDGSVVRVHMTIARLPVPEGERRRHLCMVADITESEAALQALTDREEQFRALAEQSIVGVYMTDGDRVTYLNRRGAEIFGLAPEDAVDRRIADLVLPADRERVAEAVARRIRGDADRLQAKFQGLHREGRELVVGVHGTAATVGGKRFLIGVIQDVTEKLHAEERIRRYVRQLEEAFMRTVEVATTLSEMRDPYTAGHEKRVAEVAVAIGRELGLDDRRIDGLRVAGHLHDIGKIQIPAEILAKPGKLSAAEFSLIKGHAEAGYEVLKNVEFPWPVAQVALQHHERVDGSGYPKGLKGDEILLESRITAVADVVEAMSTHRPYRPGLGIEKALAEIERGRGTAYDPAVADACLRLFRDKGFAIPA